MVLSVDPELTIDKLKKWNPSQDLVVNDFHNHKGEHVQFRVDKRTVAFVQKALQGVKLYTEWKDGEGAFNTARTDAVQELLDSLRVNAKKNKEERLLDVGGKQPVSQKQSEVKRTDGPEMVMKNIGIFLITHHEAPYIEHKVWMMLNLWWLRSF